MTGTAYRQVGATRHFPTNLTGRDYVVSDIHGCVAEFRALLDKVRFDPAVDRVFSVGDLVDRGPDSMGALRLIREPWFHAVMGNHEAMMLDALLSDDPMAMRQWITNGGTWHGDYLGDELDGLLVEARALPLAIVVGEGARRFNVVHAEFLGTDDELAAGVFEPHIAERMLWGRDLSRDPARLAELTPASPTYVGHTIVEKVGRIGSHVFIDTGAFRPWYLLGRSGRLTLVDVAAGEFIDVAAGPIVQARAA